MLNSHHQWVSEVFDRAALQYGKKDTAFFSYFGKRLVEQVKVSPGMQILDVATGRGAVLFPLASEVGPTGKVIGIDISQQMLNETKKEVLKKGLHWVELQLMDAQQLNFYDNSFDFVFCGFALFFLPSLATALSEFKRVLKPNGQLLISTWGEDSQLDAWLNSELQKLCTSSSNLAVTPLWNKQEIELYLEQSGFKDTQIIEEIKTFSYSSCEGWWDSLWHHGTRAKLERLTPHHITLLKERMLKKARSLSGGKELHEDLHVFYAKAKKVS